MNITILQFLYVHLSNIVDNFVNQLYYYR